LATLDHGRVTFVTLQTLVLLPGGVVSVAGRRPQKIS